MIRLKTSVLLACAMKIGAVMADAPAEDADLLYRFGERIGLAFQLQDDLLDVYGDTKVFGKPIGGDIVENKKTFMLINALNSADDSQRQELERWIKATAFVREEKIMAVISAMERMQSVKRSAMPCSRRARAARFSIRVIRFFLCGIMMHLLLPGQRFGFGCPRSMTTMRRNSRLFAFLRMADFADGFALMRRSVLLSTSSMRITTSAGRILWFSP